MAAEHDPASDLCASLMLSAAHGDPDAQYRLALILIRDNSTPSDRQSALRWLRQAAAQEHPQAVKALAHIEG